VLNAFFTSILNLTRGNGESREVCVCIAVPHYIKKQGRGFLKKIVLEVGFKECYVHESWSLVPFAIQADQIVEQSLVVIFDIGYHHTTITIAENGLTIHKIHKFFGAADIVCNMMRVAFEQLKQKHSNLTNLESFDSHKVFILRKACTKLLEDLSSAPSAMIFIQDFPMDDENFEFEFTQIQLDQLIDSMFTLNYMRSLMTEENLEGCSALIIGSASEVLHFKKKI